MNKLSLTKRFTFILFALVFILGPLTSFGVANIIRSHMINTVAQITSKYAENIMAQALPADFFNRQLNTSDYAKIDGVVTHDFSPLGGMGINIWNENGTILYSDDKKLIGKTFPVSENMRLASEGQTIIKATTKNETNHRYVVHQNDQFVNVYIPIKPVGSGNYRGVYEFHWDFTEVAATIKHTYEYLGIILSLGFAIIYCCLYALIRNASKSLLVQSSAIKALTGRLEKSLEEKQSTLMAALDVKDNYTAGHSVRVADLSLMIGKAIGLSKANLNILEQAALLHDLGKIGIPEQILNKPGPLTNEEFEIVKQHPLTGAHIIQQSSILSPLSKIIQHHHERYDGKGYPDSIGGEDIPLESRIMAIADTFDAMVTDRPYRKGMPVGKALAILEEGKGTQLDAALVEVFLSLHGK